MESNKFYKFRRVAAIVGIVLLLSMYVVAFIAAMFKSELANSIFMLSLYCTFVIPVIIYLLQLVYKIANKKTDINEKDK